jgi:hypothetical protein
VQKALSTRAVGHYPSINGAPFFCGQSVRRIAPCRSNGKRRPNLGGPPLMPQDYLPVLAYWMQSPWFLKGVLLARTKFCQPPFLHWSLFETS